MARVLMVWEMGAGLGHMDRMLVNARALRARGHDVHMALKDLSRAHARVVVDGFTVMQSPLWLPPLANPPRLGNYAAALAAAGWLSAPGLAGLVTAWRTLFALDQPDVVICDHAPTALLALRGQRLPVLAVGNSFEIPPPGDYFVPMAYWEPAEHSRCAAYDALLLAPANQALGLLGDEPLKRLPDLFKGVQSVILSLPELAHYDGYPPQTLAVGPTFIDDVGATPPWPDGDGPKVFAYLSAGHAEFEPLMVALRSTGWPALVHAKGISADAVKRFCSASLTIHPQALHMAHVLEQATLVISHASLGTVSAAALAGQVQLVLPEHMEQTMVSRRVERAGIGLAVTRSSQGHDFGRLLKRLVTEPGFRISAQALAQRHRGSSSALSAQHVADQVELALNRR